MHLLLQERRQISHLRARAGRLTCAGGLARVWLGAQARRAEGRNPCACLVQRGKQTSWSDAEASPRGEADTLSPQVTLGGTLPERCLSLPRTLLKSSPPPRHPPPTLPPPRRPPAPTLAGRSRLPGRARLPGTGPRPPSSSS